MSLTRVWLRQLFGIGGVAMIIPGTMVGVFAVLVLSGGFSTVGSLGQLLSGPVTPQGSPGATATAGASAGVSQTLVALGDVSPRVGVGTTGAGGVTPGARHGAAPRIRPGTPSGPGSQPTHRHGGTGAKTTPTTSTPTATTTTPQPSPTTPAKSPSLVDRVITTATGVTTKVPGAVGSSSTQTLQALGASLDSALPPPLGNRP